MTTGVDSAYLDARIRHFQREGFRIVSPDNAPGLPFALAASKVRFDIVGLPVFLEEFFVFREFPRVHQATLEGFPTEAVHWAVANENPLPAAAQLPKAAISLLGRAARQSVKNTPVRELSVAVCVYAVAMTRNLAPGAAEWVHQKKSAGARKVDRQGCFVVPMAYDLNAREYHYFRKAPLIGRAFYSEARKVIKRHLPTNPSVR